MLRALTSRPENECALVLFTGGSTGTAKAVAYSDQALVAKILAFKNGDHAYRSDDALLLFSPLFHQGGFSFLAFALLCGAKVVLQKSLRGSYVVEMLRRERITQMLLRRLPWWRGSAMPHLAATWRSLMFDA